MLQYIKNQATPVVASVRSTGGELKVDGVQGTVMESIGRTWARKGFLGFFSGNSAGSPGCFFCYMLRNQVYDCSD